MNAPPAINPARAPFASTLPVSRAAVGAGEEFTSGATPWRYSRTRLSTE